MFRIVSDPKRLGKIRPSPEEKRLMGVAPCDYYSDAQRFWYNSLTDCMYGDMGPHSFLSSYFGIDWFCFNGSGITKGTVPSRIFLVKNVPLATLNYELQHLGLPDDGVVLE